MEQDQFLKALEEVKILNITESRLGLPTKVFVPGIAISGFFFLMVKWWLGLILGVMYFASMFYLHREDEKAVQVWLHCILNEVELWQVGRTFLLKKIQILEDE